MGRCELVVEVRITGGSIATTAAIVVGWRVRHANVLHEEIGNDGVHKDVARVPNFRRPPSSARRRHDHDVAASVVAWNWRRRRRRGRRRFGGGGRGKDRAGMHRVGQHRGATYSYRRDAGGTKEARRDSAKDADDEAGS